MKKRLILFTVRFPFGGGEQFLDEELKYLSVGFDEVHIQPMFGVPGRREVPNNCLVQEPLWTGSFARFAFFFSALIRPSTWLNAVGEVKSVFSALESKVGIATILKILLWSCYRTRLSDPRLLARFKTSDVRGLVVYSYWAHTPALVRFGLAPDVPLAVRLHRTDLYLEGADSSDGWERDARYLPWHHNLDHHVDRFLFISEQGERYFREYWPVSEGKSTVSRLGTKDYGEGPEIEEEKFLIVSCSRVAPVKQVHKIAEFVRSLSNYRTIEWHHFGGTPDQCSRLQSAIEQIDPNQVAVKFWGYQPHSRLIEFYKERRVSLFVNLSSSEGVPVSIMEALSFGIPALATDVGGTSEAVISGQSGLLISLDAADNPVRLAKLTHKALQPGGEIEASRPRKLWSQRFSAKTNYSELVSSLQELLRN